MSKSLLIVYSNLGIGGMPVRITDIVNTLKKTHANTHVYILLKEKRNFDLRFLIKNKNTKILDFYKIFPYDNSVIFLCWVWYHIFFLNPSTILAFISPYALTVLATRCIFFWRNPTIIINEGHFTSTMISSMAFPSVQRLGVRLLYPHANAIIVPTNAIKEDLHKTFRITRNRIILIPNWTRYTQYKIHHTIKPYDIIYTGRLEKEKNILLLLHICKNIISTQFPSLTCILVGDGSLKNTCEDFIKGNNLSNNIFIHPPKGQVSSLVRKAKLYICTSMNSTEGFPVSILDAMALGTLVITKNFKGAREILNSSNCIITHTNSELRQQIIYTLRRYSHFTSIIHSAKKTACLHHSKKNAEHYIKLFSL